ncbi:hypothetical protein [Kitasatospora sp. NPDC059827]|uniref:hypothetical protein n=1 Tax=Kitasatospora sp. NPDC059827 TaxID=3346964 RepID=UPI00364D89C6
MAAVEENPAVAEFLAAVPACTSTPTGACHTPSGRTLRLPPGSRNSVSVDQDRTVPTPPAAPGAAAAEDERGDRLVDRHRVLSTGGAARGPGDAAHL